MDSASEESMIRLEKHHHVPQAEKVKTTIRVRGNLCLVQFCFASSAVNPPFESA